MSPEEEKRLLALAHETIRRVVLSLPPLAVVGTAPAQGVFVTIERKGQVLGCRGTLTPRMSGLDEELVAAARSAAAHDPRYRMLQPVDLRGLEVTITVIQSLAPLTDIATLRPEEGLVLKVASKVGVVLPWEGKDPKTRLEWAYKKAGVKPGSPVNLQRMKALRIKG